VRALNWIATIRSKLVASCQRLCQGEFTQKVSLLAGATAGAYGLNLAVAPLLTRIYTTSAFGHVQIYTSLMAFIIVFVALRYELSVVLPEDDDVAANLVAVSFTAILLTTAMLATAVFLALRYHLLWRRAAELGGYLWLLPVGAFGVGVYQLLNTWGLRHQAYKDVALSKFSQIGAQAAVQVGVGFATHGSIGGLIIGDACGRVSGSMRIAKVTFKRDWQRLRRVRTQTMWHAAKRYRNFPLVLAGSGLINSAGLQIVPLLLSVFYAPEMVGLYAVTDRTMQVPGVLVGQAVSQVYMVKAAQLGTSAPRALRKLFTEIVTRSLIYGIVPLVLLCAVAPTLFAIVFGESWRMAGTYARVLAPVYYLCFIHACTGMTLNMLERQHWQLAWDTSRLIAVGLTVVLGAAAGLGSTSLLSVFAAVSTVAYAVHIALCYRAIALCERQSFRLTENRQAVSVLTN
jgi:O-antigen/teichoic acid export membrane protein